MDETSIQDKYLDRMSMKNMKKIYINEVSDRVEILLLESNVDEF